MTRVMTDEELAQDVREKLSALLNAMQAAEDTKLTVALKVDHISGLTPCVLYLYPKILSQHASIHVSRPL